MKTFEYTARDLTGQTTTGRSIAENEREVDRELEKLGLTLVQVRAVRGAGKGKGRMSRDEVVAFTNQLATVIAAGVPILSGIEDLGARMRTPSGRRVLGEIAADLRAGLSLADAMERQSGSFLTLYLASIRAGELSGQLPAILRRLAAYLEWSRTMRSTTIQALVYPTILLVAILGLIVVLLTFLLPRIMDLFPGGREDLPRETQVVVALSDFLVGNAIPLSLGLAAGVVGLWLARRHPRGRLILSRLVLRVPRLGEVARMLATSKFAATAATLHKAGCDIYSVLQQAGQSCGNAWFEAGFLQASDEVRKGRTITQSLERIPGVDPLLLQIVHVGEQSGDLGGSLEQLSEYYDREVPRTVKWFLSLLEPAILLGAGGVVAFVLMAALLPIFSLYDNLS